MIEMSCVKSIMKYSRSQIFISCVNYQSQNILVKYETQSDNSVNTNMLCLKTSVGQNMYNDLLGGQFFNMLKFQIFMTSHCLKITK